MRLSINRVLFLLLFILAFAPAWGIRFTTSDDMFIDVAWELEGLRSGYSAARSQGRVQYIFGWPISAAPHFFDNQYWLFGSRIVGFASLLMAISWAAKRVFANSSMACLTIAFVILFLQNGWEHNLITSYPLIFNLYAASFFTSVALFDLALEKKSILSALISAFFYLYSLSSETFVLLAPVFVWQVMSKDRTLLTPTDSKTLSKRFQILGVVYSTLSAYLAIYWGWREYSGGTSYDGNLINGRSLRDALPVIWHYSINGFPLKSLVSFSESVDYLLGSSRINLLLVVFQSGLASVLIARLINQLSIDSRTSQRPKSVFVVGCAMFLVNLLISFTAKYQTWVSAGSRSYVYTQYSSYFAALVVSLLVTRGMQWRITGLSATMFRRIRLATTMMIVFFLSLAVGSRNMYYFDDQKRSTRKWELVDAWLSSSVFKAIPDGSSVYAPTLISNQRGIAQTTDWYWSTYVRANTQTELEFRTDSCSNLEKCYYLKYIEDELNDEQYLLFGKALTTTPISTGEITVLTSSDSSSATLLGLKNLESRSSRGTDSSGETNGVNKDLGTSFLVERLSTHIVLPNLYHVSVSDPVFVDSLFASNESSAARYVDGFYAAERAGGSVWRWAKARATIAFVNWEGEGMLVSGQVRSIHPSDEISVEVGTQILKSISVNSRSWSLFEVWVPCRELVCIFHILSGRESIQRDNGDVRDLSFRLQKLSLTPHKLFP